jgi:hypothetical protein
MYLETIFLQFVLQIRRSCSWYDHKPCFNLLNLFLLPHRTFLFSVNYTNMYPLSSTRSAIYYPNHAFSVETNKVNGNIRSSFSRKFILSFFKYFCLTTIKKLINTVFFFSLLLFFIRFHFKKRCLHPNNSQLDFNR